MEDNLNRRQNDIQLAVISTQIEDMTKHVEHIDNSLTKQESRLDDLEKMYAITTGLVRILGWLVPTIITVMPVVFHFYMQHTIDSRINYYMERSK